MRKFLYTAGFLLYASLADARVTPWYTRRDGFSGPMTWEQFAHHMSFMILGCLIVAAMIMIVHTLVTLVRKKSKKTSLIAVLFFVLLLPPINSFWLASYFYGKPIDTLGAVFVTSAVFIMSFCQIYMFYLCISFFSPRSFTKIVISIFLIVGAVAGGLSAMNGGDSALLLLMFLGAFCSLLSSKVFVLWDRLAPVFIHKRMAATQSEE